MRKRRFLNVMSAIFACFDGMKDCACSQGPVKFRKAEKADWKRQFLCCSGEDQEKSDSAVFLCDT